MKREIAAVKSYAALVTSGDQTPQQTMQAIEGWRQQHYRSDFFLLVDGRPSAQLPDLFTPPELKAFEDSLGKRN